MAEFFQRTAVASQPTHLMGDTDLTANTLHAAGLHRNLQKAVAGDSTEVFVVAAFDIHIGASQLLITGGSEAGTHGVSQIAVARMRRFGRRL